MPQVILKPQKGPQERFLATAADICIFGGSAGSGKTFAELLVPLRFKNVRGFNCVIFRHNANQIFSAGGLWDEALSMYAPITGASVHKGDSAWTFSNSSGEVLSKVSFRHIERDVEVHNYQGSQICCIEYDELTHFTKYQFFYMLSRNRSKCGIKPFVRATCNPDADSWVAEFIAWWIDQDTGYPIPERSGKIRYFIRRGDEITWAFKREELWEKFNLVTDEEKAEPKSVTFIGSSIYDNQELLKVNPQYLANLKALPEVERERLLNGNWKIKPSAGKYFKRTQVEMTDMIPADLVSVCRGWDIAATEDKKDGNPDYTSGVLIGKRKDGTFVVLDVINMRIKAGEVEKLIINTAMSDRSKYGMKCKIRIPQDPGAAGKIVAHSFVKKLSGFSVRAVPVTGSKENRAMPFAAQWQNGNVNVMVGSWNESYFSQLESFPESAHDDMVDASSDAFNEIAEAAFSLKNLI